MDKVAIFIDGSSFYKNHRVCLSSDPNVDFGKLADMLCAGRKLVRAYYYNAAISAPEQGEADDVLKERIRNQQRFFAAIQRIPYFEVRKGYLQRVDGKEQEKGVDTKIAVDMVRYAYDNVYDVAILISADGDFAYVVEAVKNTGKQVEIAFFDNAKAARLRNAGDKFVPLNRANLKECQMPRRVPPKSG